MDGGEIEDGVDPVQALFMKTRTFSRAWCLPVFAAEDPATVGVAVRP